MIGVLCVCALSVSGAIFLILELDRSFAGLPQVSGAPLRMALAQAQEPCELDSSRRSPSSSAAVPSLKCDFQSGLVSTNASFCWAG